eukprot:gene12145-14348_t
MGKSGTAEEKDGRKSQAKLDSSLQEPKKKKKKVVKEVEDSDKETERISKGRPFTVTVAIPGSIIQNKQSPQLATSLAGQIARTMSIFRVDEVVVFNCPDTDEEKKSSESGGLFLARVAGEAGKAESKSPFVNVGLAK